MNIVTFSTATENQESIITAMKLIVVLSLFISLAASQFVVKPCSHNQVCLRMRQCSSYKQYVDQPSKSWPREMQFCNAEKTDNKRTISVCCPTTLNERKCGRQMQNDKVANGKVAEPFQFPWMALLEDKSGKFVCGGTLINRRFVLTAAHCVKRAEIVSVRLGENDITRKEDCLITGNNKECTDPPQDIELIDIISHNNYSNRHKINDIALLRLKWDASLSDSVRPICLPGRSRHELAINPSRLYVSGWGLTENNKSFDVLRYAQVPPMSLDKCTPRIRRLNRSVKLGDSHVCAGGANRVDNCPGDSGGPLQYISNQTAQYVQYGVVSFGVKTCGIESEPGVYTRVDQFIDWIHNLVDGS